MQVNFNKETIWERVVGVGMGVGVLGGIVWGESGSEGVRVEERE